MIRSLFSIFTKNISTMADVLRAREFFVILPLIIVSFIIGVYSNGLVNASNLTLIGIMVIPLLYSLTMLLSFYLKTHNKFFFIGFENALKLSFIGIIVMSLFLYNPTSSDFLYSFIVPVMIYDNAETDKPKVLSDDKGKSGIYRWVNKESGRQYFGSAFDLSNRLSKYYSSSQLNRMDNYISRALIHHTHKAFFISIIEYIDIRGLSQEEARKFIISREQYHLDWIFSEDEPNIYNINPTAGSRLGAQLTS